MILRRRFRSEFMCRITCDVDVPAKTLLNLPKRRREFSQADGTNDEHVNVAQRMFAASSDRAVDKRAVDPSGERFQGLSERWQEAGRLFQETAEFGEQGRSHFGLEVAPGAFTTLFQNAAVDEGPECSLQA